MFFFQAEDGIRDYKVTGVQTCALPIFVDALCGLRVSAEDEVAGLDLSQHSETAYSAGGGYGEFAASAGGLGETTRAAEGKPRRSGERRVGKECRSRWSPDHLKKKNKYA